MARPRGYSTYWIKNHDQKTYGLPRVMSIWVFLLAVLDFATELVPFLVAIAVRGEL
jgi:hypothetical protein